MGWRRAVLGVAVAVVSAGGLEAAGPAGVRVDRYGDPLPPGAVARLGSARLRLHHGVCSLAFSPDRRTLVSASAAGNALAVWDVRTGRRVRTIPDPSYSLLLLYFSPDGRKLYAAYSLGELVEWDIRSGKERRRWKWPTPDMMPEAVSPDGKTAAWSGKGVLALLDLPTGKPGRTLKAPGKDVHGVTFSPDGKRLVVLTARKEGEGPDATHVVDLATGKVRRSFGVSAGRQQVVLAPNGATAAALTTGGEVDLWRTETGERRRLVSWGKGEFSELCFSPDGGTLLAVGVGEARLWDARTGKELRRLKLAGPPGASGFALSAGAEVIAASEEGNVLRLWDARTGRPLFRYAGHVRPPMRLAYSADGKRLFAHSGLSHLGNYCWDVGSGRLLARVVPETAESYWAAPQRFSPGGRRMALAEDTAIRLYDPRRVRPVRELKGHAKGVADVTFSPDGKQVASLDSGRVVRVWDADTGRVVRVIALPKREEPACWVLFAPDNRTLAVGEDLLSVHLYDSATGTLRGTLKGDPERWEEGGSPGGPWECRFSPDGKTLFTSCMDVWQVWDVAAGREVFGVGDEREDDEKPPQEAFGAAFDLSPDGRLVARLGWVKGPGLWETASRQLVYRFEGMYPSATFAPGGVRLATSCGEECSVLIWDLKELFRQLPGPARGVTLWDALADSDARRAFGAVGRLACDEKAGLALLRAKLRPVRRADPAVVRRLVRELGSPEFATRQAAESTLAGLREAAGPALEEAHQRGSALEAKLRAGRLLRRLDSRSVERLREVRAVQALELIGTNEARAVLRGLAKGEPEARLTQEAKAALGRLEARR